MKTLIARHKAGEHIGICSVCSAHPLVIEAALAFDRNSTRKVLIEATSNRVNQFGGYTGMTPADFREFVLRLPIKSDLLVSVLFSAAPSGTKLLAARKCGCGDGKIRRAGKGICSCRLQ